MKCRDRVCLQDGSKLDLNRLARRGFLKPGACSGPVGIRWWHSYFDEEIASGIITADWGNAHEGRLRIQIGSLDQQIILISWPRHFGGGRWYFMCPVMNIHAPILWKPSAASRFCSRQTWGGRVA